MKNPYSSSHLRKLARKLREQIHINATWVKGETRSFYKRQINKALARDTKYLADLKRAIEKLK